MGVKVPFILSILYILLGFACISPKSISSIVPQSATPQGQTIQGGLHQLGFDSVQSVRAGKYMEITLKADSESTASSQVREMCDKLLANPVIEDYRFDLEPLP